MFAESQQSEMIMCNPLQRELHFLFMYVEKSIGDSCKIWVKNAKSVTGASGVLVIRRQASQLFRMSCLCHQRASFIGKQMPLGPQAPK